MVISNRDFPIQLTNLTDNPELDENVDTPQYATEVCKR